MVLNICSFLPCLHGGRGYTASCGTLNLSLILLTLDKPPQRLSPKSIESGTRLQDDSGGWISTGYTTIAGCLKLFT